MRKDEFNAQFFESLRPKPVIEETKQESEINSDQTCFDCNVPIVPAVCATENCKKKPTKECVTGMCFTCCFELKTSCSAHFRMRKKREEEDRLIAAGLQCGSKKKTSFYHYESKFMKCDQTVVIWCLQDFLRRKEWSSDTMAQYKREMRTQALLHRRHNHTDTTTATSTTTTTSTGTTSTTTTTSTGTTSTKLNKNAKLSTTTKNNNKRGYAKVKTKTNSSTTSSSASNKPIKHSASTLKFQKVMSAWEKKFKLCSK